MENAFAWRLLLLASLFVFPQLLGVLFSLRLTRLPRWIGRALGIIVPALSFFFLAPHFFFAGMREDEGCGMPAVAAAFMLLLGTGIHLLIALVIQLRFTRT